MDCKKVGALIKKLRREKGYSQRALAELIFVSDKTVSKWERGRGFPDVTLLSELSRYLGVNIEAIVLGQLKENTAINGNMKKQKLYFCDNCGNILTALGEAEIMCCGRYLSECEARPTDGTHLFAVQEVEDEYFLTSAHPMTKEHFISAVYILAENKLNLIKLYPEQSIELRFQRTPYAELYFLCNKDGLFQQKIAQRRCQ